MATQLEIINFALSHIGEPPITELTAGSTKAADAVNATYQLVLESLLRKYRWNFARESKVLTPSYVAIVSLAAHSGGQILVETSANHGLADGTLVTLENTGADGVYSTVSVTTKKFYLADSVYRTGLTLGKFTVSPPHTFGYFIALPDDCLKLRSLNDYETDNLDGATYQLQGRNILLNENEARVVYTRRLEAGGEDEFDSTFVEVFSFALGAAVAMPITGASSKRDECNNLMNAALMDALRTNAFERKPPAPQRAGSNTIDIVRIYGESV